MPGVEVYKISMKFVRSILPPRLRALPRILWVKFSYSIFKSRIVHHRYGSYQLTMEIIDAQGALWFDRDVNELPDLGFLSQHRLRPGAKVLNIGAGQGLLTMLLAKMVAPGGFVWAIEPDPRQANAARRNLQLNAIANCEVIGNVAGNLGSSECTPRSELVAALQSASVSRGDHDVVTIDADGHECAVLEALRGPLRQCSPDWFIEVQPGGSVGQLLSFFPSERYRRFIRELRAAGFREVQTSADLPRERFVLIAIAHDRVKNSPATAGQSCPNLANKPNPKPA